MGLMRVVEVLWEGDFAGARRDTVLDERFAAALGLQVQVRQKEFSMDPLPDLAVANGTVELSSLTTAPAATAVTKVYVGTARPHASIGATVCGSLKELTPTMLWGQSAKGRVWIVDDAVGRFASQGLWGSKVVGGAEAPAVVASVVTADTLPAAIAAWDRWILPQASTDFCAIWLDVDWGQGLRDGGSRMAAVLRGLGYRPERLTLVSSLRNVTDTISFNVVKLAEPEGTDADPLMDSLHACWWRHPVVLGLSREELLGCTTPDQVCTKLEQALENRPWPARPAGLPPPGDAGLRNLPNLKEFLYGVWNDAAGQRVIERLLRCLGNADEPGSHRSQIQAAKEGRRGGGAPRKESPKRRRGNGAGDPLKKAVDAWASAAEAKGLVPGEELATSLAADAVKRGFPEWVGKAHWKKAVSDVLARVLRGVA